MGLKEDPRSELGSETPFPTAKELFSQLRSSFFVKEFERVEKTLVEREEHTSDKYAKLEKTIESLRKEKDSLILEKKKLNDELKKKQKESEKLRNENTVYCDEIRVLKREVSRNLEVEDELKKKQREIDEVRKVNAEYERKEGEFRVYEKKLSDFGERILSLEKIGKELGSLDESPLVSLENKQQKTCDAERSKPPLFDEKGGSTKRIEPKSQEIIQIDDDDDDDQIFISTLKRKRVSYGIKIEVDDDDGNSSYSDDENVDDVYKSIIAKKKMQKER